MKNLKSLRHKVLPYNSTIPLSGCIDHSIKYHWNTLLDTLNFILRYRHLYTRVYWHLYPSIGANILGYGY